MKTIQLKTVRPFVFEDLLLKEYKDEISTFKIRSEAVEEFVDNYIENVLISKAAEQQTGKKNYDLYKNFKKSSKRNLIIIFFYRPPETT